MIIYMAPGVQLSGTNVGGSELRSQPTISSRGTSANVQWNLEGGATTDLRSNTSASYYNFDALEQIQVINGGGDVSVQSSGVSINLITKSGSNVFKGSAVGTLTNDAMQFQNVSEELFKTGTGGFLSGAPLNRVTQRHGRVRRTDHPQQAVVLGQRRSPGHQHGGPELLRRQQGRASAPPTPTRSASARISRHDHVRQPGRASATACTTTRR